LKKDENVICITDLNDKFMVKSVSKSMMFNLKKAVWKNIFIFFTSACHKSENPAY